MNIEQIQWLGGILDDPEASLEKAVEIARESLAGRIAPLETGRLMAAYIDPWHPTWEALNGSFGPLAAFHVAADALHRLHFVGNDVKRHAMAGEAKQRELAAAEATIRTRIHEACRALIEYAEARY
jgi:hypothetical protein